METINQNSNDIKLDSIVLLFVFFHLEDFVLFHIFQRLMIAIKNM